MLFKCLCTLCCIKVHFFFGLPLFRFPVVASSSALGVGRRFLVDVLVGAAGGFVTCSSCCRVVSCTSVAVLLFSVLSSSGRSGDFMLITAICWSSASRTARLTNFVSGDTLFLVKPRRPERRVFSAPLTDCSALVTPWDFGDTLYRGLVPGDKMSDDRGLCPPSASVAAVCVCISSACDDLFEPSN